jgi:hypothetical protein
MTAKKAAPQEENDIDEFYFNPAERILNGQRAENLLRDPVLNAVFVAVADRYRQSWENSARGDIATQQAAHYSLAALKDVIAQIRAHLGSAKMFEADLKVLADRQRKESYWSKR